MPQTLTCDSVIAAAVLEAAQAIAADHVAHGRALVPYPLAQKQQPLLPLLMALLDSTKAVAAAIADNAWDDSLPLSPTLALDLARDANAIANDLINASQCPDCNGWSLPSATGRELI